MQRDASMILSHVIRDESMNLSHDTCGQKTFKSKIFKSKIFKSPDIWRVEN